MVEEQHQVSSYTLEQMGVWLELFYDLVFVAAILVFSSAVSHLHDASRITWVVAVFCAVWWIWLSTTMFTNRFHTADVVHRGLVLAQMIMVALVAMEARAGVADDEVLLLCTYAALVATDRVHVLAGRARPRTARQASPGTWRASTRSPRACFLACRGAAGVRTHRGGGRRHGGDDRARGVALDPPRRLPAASTSSTWSTGSARSPSSCAARRS